MMKIYQQVKVRSRIIYLPPKIICSLGQLALLLLYFPFCTIKQLSISLLTYQRRGNNTNTEKVAQQTYTL